MKKILGITFSIFLLINTSSSSDPNLDIGEGSKILDMNFVCSNVLEISDQQWFGIKIIKDSELTVFTYFDLDSGEYGLPNSMLLNFGETQDGYVKYVAVYGLSDLNSPTIFEDILYIKDHVNLKETILEKKLYELDKKEVPKIINEIKGKMSKEFDNTKYIELQKQLTYEFDKILGTKKFPALKLKMKLKYNCNDSKFILKSSY